MAKRHLHFDFHTAYCGRDISYILATYDPKEMTCDACKKEWAKADPKERANRLELERAGVEARKPVLKE